MTDNSRRFYVYAFLRSKDSSTGPKYSPYYIGKGSGRRAFRGTARSFPAPKDQSYIVFLQEGLTEEEAFNLEKYCIALYGRVDLNTGILRNLTDGGEGASGARRSQETRRKLSEANQGKFAGEANPFWGKKHSEETKRRLSEAKKGANGPQWGIPRTQEQKDKTSIASRKYRYMFTSPSGKIYITESLTRFAKEQNLLQPGLWQVIAGKRKHHRGWTGKIIGLLQ
jgi:hypothetical protein